MREFCRVMGAIAGYARKLEHEPRWRAIVFAHTGPGTRTDRIDEGRSTLGRELAIACSRAASVYPPAPLQGPNHDDVWKVQDGAYGSGARVSLRLRLLVERARAGGRARH